MIKIEIQLKLREHPTRIILLITHYISTLIMTGAIWLAQLSQYPLLAYVGRRNFIRYEHEHIRRISTIAWIFIYIEALTGLFLVFANLPSITLSLRLYGLILIMAIWSTTWFIQYPIHKKLSHGFDKKLHQRLVRTNWIRTISWTLRSILLTYILTSILI